MGNTRKGRQYPFDPNGPRGDNKYSPWRDQSTMNTFDIISMVSLRIIYVSFHAYHICILSEIDGLSISDIM